MHVAGHGMDRGERVRDSCRFERIILQHLQILMRKSTPAQQVRGAAVVCCGTKPTGSMKAFMREESISTFVAVPSKLLYRWWLTGSRSAHCCSLHLVATAAREGCFAHHMCLGLTMNSKRWPTAYRESTHQQQGHLAGGSSSKHSTQHSNCTATLMLLAEASNP